MEGGRGIVHWNHATELLKQHGGSKWHQHSSFAVRMAKYVAQQNATEMQCVGAAKQPEEPKKQNHEIILKLMRSIYFLAKNHIPPSNTNNVIEHQVLNGDGLFEKHLSEGPSCTVYIKIQC